MVELYGRSTEGSDWSSDEPTKAPGGYGATEMAENETLDLWKNNSPRRRALLSLFQSDASTVVSVARALEDDLFSNGRKLVKRQFLKKLLAPTCGSGDVAFDLHRINGDEFAQVFALESARTENAKDALENSLWFFVERVLDQIGQEVVPSRRWPDFVVFRNFAADVEASLMPAVHALAEQLNQSPDRSPRQPRQTQEDKDEWQHDLQRLSLLPLRNYS